MHKPPLDLNPHGAPIAELARATELHARQVRRAIDNPADAPLDHVLKLLEAAGAREVRLTVTNLDESTTVTKFDLAPDTQLWGGAVGDPYKDQIPAIAVKLRDTPDAVDLSDRARHWWRLDPRRLAAHDPKRLLAVRLGIIIGAWNIDSWHPDSGRIEFDLAEEVPSLVGQRLDMPGQAPARYLP